MHTIKKISIALAIFIGGISAQSAQLWPAKFEMDNRNPLHINLLDCHGSLSVKHGERGFGIYARNNDNCTNLIVNGQTFKVAEDIYRGGRSLFVPVVPPVGRVAVYRVSLESNLGNTRDSFVLTIFPARTVIPSTTYVLEPGQYVDLFGCGGTLTFEASRSGQGNIVLRNVNRCNEFVIQSNNGYGLQTPYSKEFNRNASFTIPQGVIVSGRNALIIRIRDPWSGRSESALLRFTAY